MKDQMISVPFCPNELNRICQVILSVANSKKYSRWHRSTVAIGCPMGLSTIFCKSDPMQKAKATLTPFKYL